jgi:hypothetical protein
MSAKARKIARNILISARVVEIERQALAAAQRDGEAGTGSSIPASLPPARPELVVDRDLETFSTMENVKGQGKDTRGRPRPLFVIPPQHRRLRTMLLHMVVRR